jgi:hypothetical protein
MEGLEFLRPMGDQQKQIIAQNKELSDLIKQVLGRPLPPPVIKIDYNELALELKKLIGDPAGNISKANKEFKSTVNQFGRMASDVPKSVSIRGEFYGFTGWKPFLFFLLVLVGCAGYSGYTWFRNKELLNYIEKNHSYILNLKEDYPKLARKYFDY